MLGVLEEPRPDTEPGLDVLLEQLVGRLAQRRLLLVLDGVESALAAGLGVAWCPGQEGYGRVLTRFSAGGHAGCLLLIGREQPADLVRLARDSDGRGVRTATLTGLDRSAEAALLTACGLAPEAGATLGGLYSGNPLALTLAARAVIGLFGGDAAAFLHSASSGPPSFDDLRAVLDAQLSRLSAIERQVVTTLTIACEPLTVTELRQRLMSPGPARGFVEALGSLERRSLLEPGPTLPRLLARRVAELMTGGMVRAITKVDPHYLNPVALLHPDAPDDVRARQVRLVLAPAAERLTTQWGRAGVAAALPSLFDALRARGARVPGYAAGNLINLALLMGLDLTGVDASQLCVWQVDPRAAAAAGLNLTGSDLTGPDLHGVA